MRWEHQPLNSTLTWEKSPWALVTEATVFKLNLQVCSGVLKSQEVIHTEEREPGWEKGVGYQSVATVWRGCVEEKQRKHV